MLTLLLCRRYHPRGQLPCTQSQTRNRLTCCARSRTMQSGNGPPARVPARLQAVCVRAQDGAPSLLRSSVQTVRVCLVCVWMSEACNLCVRKNGGTFRRETFRNRSRERLCPLPSFSSGRTVNKGKSSTFSFWFGSRVILALCSQKQLAAGVNSIYTYMCLCREEIDVGPLNFLIPSTTHGKEDG